MAGCLIILNGPPYGNEYSYNGQRLAGSLVRQPEFLTVCFPEIETYPIPSLRE